MLPFSLPALSSLQITDRSFRHAAPCLWNQLSYLFCQLLSFCLVPCVRRIKVPSHACAAVWTQHRNATQLVWMNLKLAYSSDCQYALWYSYKIPINNMHERVTYVPNARTEPSKIKQQEICPRHTPQSIALTFYRISYYVPMCLLVSAGDQIASCSRVVAYANYFRGMWQEHAWQA